MLSELEGVIARRVLLNFRADPAVVAPLIPRPFELIEQNGYALVGICLIRFAELRPAGWPRLLGWSPQSMAHRAAIRFEGADGIEEGVYIFRRDTSDRAVSLLGGHLFPGVQSKAAFEGVEMNGSVELAIQTRRAVADVSFRAAKTRRWTAQSKLFSSLDEATVFLARGDCGFSPSGNSRCLEGMRLSIEHWRAAPLTVDNLRASFFENPLRFPPGSVEFDHALLMENVAHHWWRVRPPAHETTATSTRATKSRLRHARPFVRFFDV